MTNHTKVKWGDFLVEAKRCNACKKVVPLMFYNRSSTRYGDGLHTQCKFCKQKARRDSYLKRGE